MPTTLDALIEATLPKLDKGTMDLMMADILKARPGQIWPDEEPKNTNKAKPKVSSEKPKPQPKELDTGYFWNPKDGMIYLKGQPGREQKIKVHDKSKTPTGQMKRRPHPYHRPEQPRKRKPAA